MLYLLHEMVGQRIFRWKKMDVNLVGKPSLLCGRGSAQEQSMVFMRKVPKLLPSFIERDAWTKLNVAPAKIMQVSCYVTYWQIACKLRIINSTYTAGLAHINTHSQEFLHIFKNSYQFSRILLILIQILESYERYCNFLKEFSRN